MIHDGVELHNVAALTDRDGGRRLDRLPGAVRRELNDDARRMYTRPAGSEIRCVSDEERVAVTLSCPDGRCQATPRHGSFLSAPDARYTIGAEPTTIELPVPGQLHELDAALVDGMAFRPTVRRLVLRGDPVVLHGIEGETRPPRSEELPARRYLAYGTSITQGSVATDHHLTYVEQTARRLGADLLNLGTSGSAFCEPAIADHVAGRDDWDVATLSISVNMLGSGFTAEEFRERATYLIETVADAHPETPIACITLFPLFPDLGLDSGEPWAADPETYRTVLREVVADVARENVHPIEGPDLLTDATGLAPDLLHPTDHGMIEIGKRLAPRLEALLAT